MGYFLSPLIEIHYFQTFQIFCPNLIIIKQKVFNSFQKCQSRSIIFIFCYDQINLAPIFLFFVSKFQFTLHYLLTVYFFILFHVSIFKHYPYTNLKSFTPSNYGFELSLLLNVIYQSNINFVLEDMQSSWNAIPIRKKHLKYADYFSFMNYLSCPLLLLFNFRIPAIVFISILFYHNFIFFKYPVHLIFCDTFKKVHEIQLLILIVLFCIFNIFVTFPINFHLSIDFKRLS